LDFFHKCISLSPLGRSGALEIPKSLIRLVDGDLFELGEVVFVVADEDGVAM
jgi:hypothetical protein